MSSNSNPSVTETFRHTVRRSVAAWNAFFFTPRSPYTLGLMRLCAGIFILYVHLMGHSYDLYSFFGPDGWADQKVTEDSRKNYPFFPPTNAWNDTYNIVPPADRQMREVVLLEWMQNLPSDIARRRAVLAYLEHLPHNDPYALNSAMIFAERLSIRPKDEFQTRRTRRDFRPTTDKERQDLLDALTRPTLFPADKENVPQFMHDLSLVQRQQIRDEAVSFVDTMPKDPGQVAMVMLHLASQGMVPVRAVRPSDPRTELQRTLAFITREDKPGPNYEEQGPYLPDDLTKRREILEYMTTWTYDSRRTLGKGQYMWSVFFHVTDRDSILLVHVIFLIAMAMFAAGLFTRVTSVITWIGVISYINRCNQMVFGMDTMMNIACIYLMIGPSGACLSLDRWLEKRRARQELEKAKREKRDTSEWEAILAGPRPSVLAGFVTRLVQIHFCFIYAASGLSKMKGPAWWNHSAIWSTIVNPEFSPTVFQPYMWLILQLSEYRWMAEIVMSLGAAYTLFLEIGLPFLVWRPVLRPYMVMAAILLHTGIAVFMGLTVFGLFMLVLLMAFIPPETVLRWLELGERRRTGAQKKDKETRRQGDKETISA